jgi:hypothetical protein
MRSKSIFIAKLCILLNYCILINNELTLFRNLKCLDFGKIHFLYRPHEIKNDKNISVYICKH